MLLARLAHLLYRHRWLTIGLWLVLALLSLPLAPRLPGLVQAGGLFSADMESERAHQAMVALAGQPRDIVLVVVAGETLTLDDLPFQTFLQTLAIRLSGLPGVRGVITPDLAPSQVAPDRRTVYLTIQWETEALPHLAAVEEILAELTPPGLRAYPTGGAVAYRRTAWEEVGGFDEQLFMYLEDVDLAWRLRLLGWEARFAPRARVYHHLSASGGGTLASFYTGRNTLWVLARDVPGPLLRRYWPAIIRAQLRIARDALRAWRGDAARARLRGQLAGLAGLPRWLAQRPALQARRRVPIEALDELLV